MVHQCPLKDLTILMRKADPKYEEMMEDLLPLKVIPKEGKEKNFKLTDESHVLHKVPRKDNMYSVDLKNFVTQGGLTYLFAKATLDELILWHRRLGHVNFKTVNKLDETSEILKIFITSIENLIDLRVKVIRCDNGTKFKNMVMNQFSEMKGIKREFSVARTPQQNGVVERKNRTLIEAAWTMLVDSKLPTTLWAEAVNTACYVQNRVFVIKPQNKTPYELFLGRRPALSFMRPFGCPVTILNTIDHLGKFDGKADEGFFVGYSTNNKAFRVFNSRTRIVEENLHVQLSENLPNIEGSGPNWLFDIDALTKFMNYKPVVVRNQSNGNPGTNECDDAGEDEKKVTEELEKEGGDSSNDQAKDDNNNSTNNVYVVSSTVNAVGIEDNVVDENIVYGCADDPSIPELEDIVYSDDDKDVGEEADITDDVKTASTPMETHKPLLKDADGEDVDEHLYRSMIGSLMYLTSSRLDIMFVDSPFDLVAFTDSDYAGASLDRKHTTGSCQFLRCRLISWQCKKHNVVANSTTEAEYIAASN
ncbi:ribonuclease H-like domain-containing protein [Tanacetum coccineum]